MRTVYHLPSAVASPLRASFPNARLRVTPDPYDGEVSPDDTFYTRNTCDICQEQIEVTYPMVATRTTHGLVEVLCAACFCRKYVSYALRYAGSCLDGRTSLSERLVYVLVLEGGKFYRWETDHA